LVGKAAIAGEVARHLQLSLDVGPDLGLRIAAGIEPAQVIEPHVEQSGEQHAL